MPARVNATARTLSRAETARRRSETQGNLTHSQSTMDIDLVRVQCRCEDRQPTRRSQQRPGKHRRCGGSFFAAHTTDAMA